MFWIIQFQFMGHLDAHRFKLWFKSVILWIPHVYPYNNSTSFIHFFRRISKIFMEN